MSGIGPDFVRTMAAYNAEMNRRVYGAAARLDESARRAERGAFWGSIHATLAHLPWADRMWMTRFGLGTAPDLPIARSGGYVEDFDEMRDRRIGEDAGIVRWADSLRPDDLEGGLSWWSGALGRQMEKPRALIVVHIFNHQTHHRGQVHAMLTAAGERVGDTDLPFVL